MFAFEQVFVLHGKNFPDILESFHAFLVGLGSGVGTSQERLAEERNVHGVRKSLGEHRALVVAAQSLSFWVQGYRHDGIYGGASGVGQQFFSQFAADHHADVWFVVVFQVVQGFLDRAFSGKVVRSAPPLHGQPSPEAGRTDIVAWIGQVEGNILPLAAQTEAGVSYGKILLAGNT